MALPAGRRGIRANLVKSDGTISDLTKLKEDFAALSASDIPTIDVPLFKSLTGNPVTISDAAGEKAKCAKATLEPIQDLHGYDHPWAGGAGKNKVNGDVLFSDYLISPNKYKATNLNFLALEFYLGDFIGQTITVSTNFTTVSGITRVYVQGNVNGSNIDGTYIAESGISKVTLTPTSADDYVRITYGSYTGNVNVEWEDFQLELGSIATSWAPYSNICPITGRTQVEISNKDSEDVEQASVIVDLGQTVYGGTLNVTTGELTVKTANIASYDGETIGEPWWSSMDEYVEGTTPTTGAQVVYTLAAPTTVSLTPAQIQLLTTTNIISTNADVLSILYRATEEGNVEGALQYLFDKVEELSAQINE